MVRLASCMSAVFVINSAVMAQTSPPSAAMLVAAQGMLRTSAPDMLTFEPTEPYRDRSFTRISLTAQGQQGEMAQFANAALYYGNVGGFFYISTSLKSLHNIVDGLASTASGPAVAGTMPAAAATQPAVPGNFALRLNLANAKDSKAAAEFYLGQEAQSAEAAHRQNILLLAQTVGLGEKAVATPQQVLGYSINSAIGNSYRYDAAHDEVVGSVTGSQWSPVKPLTIPDESTLGHLVNSIQSISARLSFTADGLQTDLRIQRK